MKDLLLFPFSGNAREAIAVVEAINRIEPTWNIIGFIDDSPEKQGQEFAGYPVLGGRELLDSYPSAKVIAVPGRPENFRIRDLIINNLSVAAERYATLIHPAASVGPACQIGYNTVIMAGVVLTTGVKIGNHCVILPNSVIAHESSLGDFCLVGSTVSVSGGVTIEPKCYIGSGTKIIQETTIGTGSLAGIGSVVIKSVDPGTVVVGNPARPLPTSTLAAPQSQTNEYS